MISFADFTGKYPEFASITEALFNEKLATAQGMISAAVFGDVYEQAVYLKTAHLVALSPHGGQARLNKFSEKTVYGVAYEELKRAIPVRMLTT